MKNSLSILCLVFCTIVMSCEEQQQLARNSEKSGNITITITSPEYSDTYSGDVLIEAQASGKFKIESMEILVDGARVHSTSADVISYLLNTLQYTDGEHTVKIVATNKKHETASLNLILNVSNSFITLNMVVNTQEPGTLYFYYLNDENGNVVSDLKQVDASTTEVKFTTPAGHSPGKKYALAYVEHWPSYYGYNAVTSIQIVTGYSEGTYYEMIGYPPYRPVPVAGIHTVNLTNFGDEVSINYQSEVTGGVFIYNTNTLQIPIEKNNATAYLAIKGSGGVPSYKFLSGLNVGEVTTLDASEVIPMDGVTIPSSPGAYSTFSFVTGFKVAGDYVNPKVVWYNYPFGGGPPEYNYQQYYPGNAFAEYMSGMFEGVSGHSDEYVSVGATPATAFKKINGGITGYNFSGNSFTFHSEGTYDVLTAGTGISTTNGPYADYSFNVTLANGEVTYSIPQIPASLTQSYGYPPLSQWNWETQYLSIGVTDYSGLDGYNDYFHATFANATITGYTNDWVQHSRQYTSRYEIMYPSGARGSSTRRSAKAYFSRNRTSPVEFQRLRQEGK